MGDAHTMQPMRRQSIAVESRHHGRRVGGAQSVRRVSRCRKSPMGRQASMDAPRRGRQPRHAKPRREKAISRMASGMSMGGAADAEGGGARVWSDRTPAACLPWRDTRGRCSGAGGDESSRGDGEGGPDRRFAVIRPRVAGNPAWASRRLPGIGVPPARVSDFSDGHEKTAFRRFRRTFWCVAGGRCRDRTCDPCRVKAMLYR